MRYIVVVAPSESDLAYAPLEVQELINAHNNARLVHLSQDDRALFATVDLLRAQGHEIAGLWYIGHGTRDAIILGDLMLDATAIIAHVQHSGAEWIVVNTCQGEAFLRLIHMATGVGYLTTSVVDGGMIEDQEAWRMAAVLARSLFEYNGDLGLAYAHASPRGSGAYVYKPRIQEMSERDFKGSTTGYTGGEKAQRDIDELYKTVSALDTRVSILEATISFRLEQILSSIVEIKSDVASIKRERDDKDDALMRSTRVLTWVGAIFALTLFFTVMIIEFRIIWGR